MKTKDALTRLHALQSKYRALLLRIMTGELSPIDPTVRALFSLIEGEYRLLNSMTGMIRVYDALTLEYVGSEYGAIFAFFETMVAQDEVLVLSLEIEYLLTLASAALLML